MKRDESKQSGITLVSLVITIIILLILAGVAINLAIDSNGLFSHANTAVTKWNQAVANEAEAIQNILDQAEEIVNSTGDLPVGWEASKVADVITENSEVMGVTKERKAPVPTGYVASQIPGENTITGGLVIYEGNEAVSGNKNSTSHTNAMTTRNQYVWIPVDNINQMVMCKSNTGTSVCNLVLKANGTLKCETHNSEELCGRLYGVDYTETTVDGKKVRSTNMNFADRSQTWTNNSGYREPDIVSSKDTDSTTGNLATFTTNMTNDFKTMAKSVATYGGFYVSRYEVGEGGSSKQGQTVLTAAASSANMWYGLYNTLRGTNKHMIWGSQYDQMIHFIGAEAQTGHIDKQTTTSKVSGYEGDTDIMKNIYDLEGNFREWTAQAGNTLNRVNRGGNYYTASGVEFDSASYRINGIPDSANGAFSSRHVLYM